MQLQRFTNGDTGYVAKHNANAEALESSINGLLTQVAGAMGSSATVGDAFVALFGTHAGVIGAGSYACAGAGAVLTVQPGYCWLASARTVRTLSSAATLNFSGVGAGTWYVSADSSGQPIRSANSADALYSVDWSGTAFTSISRIAAVVWGASDWLSAQASAALGASYTSLDARLEAGESTTKTHIGAPVGAHAASAISNTPAGGIAATTVQGAINELDADKYGAGASATFESVFTTQSISVGANSASATINGTVYTGKLAAHAEGSDTAFNIGSCFAGNSAGVGARTMGGRSRGTQALPAVVQNGDVLYQHHVCGYDGTDYATAGMLEFFVDGAPGADDMPCGFRLYLSTDGTQILAAVISAYNDKRVEFGGNRIRIATAKTPLSSTDTGSPGEICWDSNYIYVCTAVDTWKRSPIASW